MLNVTPQIPFSFTSRLQIVSRRVKGEIRKSTQLPGSQHSGQTFDEEKMNRLVTVGEIFSKIGLKVFCDY